MERSDTPQNERIELRVPAEAKSIIARAAALEHTNVTSFILSNVLPKARELVSEAERITLSERDTLKILELLENPPAPTERMIHAARAEKRLV